LITIKLPVIGQKISYCRSLLQFAKLGILYFTWASEHYRLEKVKSEIKTEGFEIQNIQHIGHHIYESCVAYYIQNRSELKKRLRTKTSSHITSFSSRLTMVIFGIHNKLISTILIFSIGTVQVGIFVTIFMSTSNWYLVVTILLIPY
jgi:hypothetical protein